MLIYSFTFSVLELQ